MVDEPKGNKDSFGYATGGWVAAPAVNALFQGLLLFLGFIQKTNCRQKLDKF